MAQTSDTDSIRLRDDNAINANTGSGLSRFKTGNYYRLNNRWLIDVLSPLEPATRHRDILTTRMERVGDWLLGTREFREWRDGKGGTHKAVLFCSGNPGVGKTYLRSVAGSSERSKYH